MSIVVSINMVMVVVIVMYHTINSIVVKVLSAQLCADVDVTIKLQQIESGELSADVICKNSLYDSMIYIAV